MEGDEASCTNTEWLGIPTTINIYPESIENACNDHIDECDDYHPLSELISKNCILALLTEESDYYLLKATSKSTVLQQDERDNWGASYKSGDQVVCGKYFMQSIVPVQSFLYMF